MPRLTLELGVRYDYEILPAPSKALTTATTGLYAVCGRDEPSQRQEQHRTSGWLFL